MKFANKPQIIPGKKCQQENGVRGADNLIR